MGWQLACGVLDPNTNTTPHSKKATFVSQHATAGTLWDAANRAAFVKFLWMLRGGHFCTRGRVTSSLDPVPAVVFSDLVTHGTSVILQLNNTELRFADQAQS